LNFLDSFIQWSHSCLMENDDAKSYLRGRGVSEEQWVRHRLGFTYGDFSVNQYLDPGHNKECGNKYNKRLWCDSCRYINWSTSWIKDEDCTDYEPKHPIIGRRIANSIIFPLTNYSGGTVGFVVRSIYEKSYDTFVLRHRPEGYFFGISKSVQSIWTSKEAWIVEGPFDFLVLERLVTENILGLVTSSTSKEQAKFLRRFTVTVNSCLDLDAAGRKGFRSLIKWNSSYFKIRDIKYPSIKPNDKDLGDFWQSVGDDCFKHYFKDRVISQF